MRSPCLMCVKKHLGQAEVLMAEALRGYPEHQWLAVGHLAEAEEELLGISVDFSNEIRDYRVKYMEDIKFPVPIVELLKNLSNFKVAEPTKEEKETAEAIDNLIKKDELLFKVEFSEEQFNSKKISK